MTIILTRQESRALHKIPRFGTVNTTPLHIAPQIIDHLATCHILTLDPNHPNYCKREI